MVIINYWKTGIFGNFSVFMVSRQRRKQAGQSTVPGSIPGIGINIPYKLYVVYCMLIIDDYYIYLIDIHGI